MSRRRRRLPDSAEDFLASLTPTLKASTCSQYRQSLIVLHNWLDARGHPLKTLSREQVSRWLQHLVERGQSAITRRAVIIMVRLYLRALHDAGLLDANVDELLRTSDQPKVPVYLPRPFSPQVDQELQRRFAASSDPYLRGLLVMRNTGLRVGELSGLAINCVREDGFGNVFLKVPLGKMNTERLVPLDPRTLAVVQGLQRTGRPNRELLLETARGLRTRRDQLGAALREATTGLTIPDRVTTHRLRHTYATALLSAGVSLTSIMKLLGHTDYRMTLRYAQITFETVGKEYREAMAHLEARYRIELATPSPPHLEPNDALADIIRWVQKRVAPSHARRNEAHALVRRLRRIREELKGL